MARSYESNRRLLVQVQLIEQPPSIQNLCAVFLDFRNPSEIYPST